MKVVIEMDEGWRWWPIDEQNPGWYRIDTKIEDRKVAIEITEEMYERYKRVSAEYFEIQEQMEHLYRHQQGYYPHLQSPFHPDHKGE
jgi:hypothetical protein